MENAAKSSVCAAYFSLMKAEETEAGAGVLHFTTVAVHDAGGG